MKRKIHLLIILVTLASCSVPPEMRTDNIPTVDQFDLNRYLGKWYEIARLPNRFEENLEQVTANYSLKEDGDIKVVNRGFNTEENEWEEAEGNARVKDNKNPSHLEVSFFWIFYSDYKVIALDKDNYQWSMVTSKSKKYLWILSRSKALEDSTYNSLIETAKGYGFDVESIIKVNQM